MLKAIFNLILNFLKYFLVGGALTTATMSLVTGKFPPPYKDMYKQLKSVQGSVDIQDSTKAVMEYKKNQALVMNQIENAEKSTFTQGNGGQVNGRIIAGAPSTQDWEKRVKALEYEVAYYKSKLARSEWERDQLAQKLNKK